jgi:arsenate reductase
MDLYPDIETYVSSLNVDEIPEERRRKLEPVIGHLSEKLLSNGVLRMAFICTHNSRRSHLAQIWAQTLAHHLGISAFEAYSAGTEATALYPLVIQTLEKAGFRIQELASQPQSVYAIKYSDNEAPIIGFSKTLDNPFNPAGGFTAIMTCSQADAGCPFVPGAEKRFPITYDDPKIYDNSDLAHEKYEERSRQIATEWYYAFQQSLKS